MTTENAIENDESESKSDSKAIDFWIVKKL